MTRFSRASRRVADSWRAFLEPDAFSTPFKNAAVTAVLLPIVIALTPVVFLLGLMGDGE